MNIVTKFVNATLVIYLVLVVSLADGLANNFPSKSDPSCLELPVPDYSQVAKEESFRRGLSMLLNGNQRVDPRANSSSDWPMFRAALKHPESYVKQFKYISKIGPQRVKGLFLQIHFDQEAIKQILQSHTNWLWISNSPQVILWLTGYQGSRVILNHSYPDPQFIVFLKQQAKRVGLDLLLPLVDLAELSQVRGADLRNLNLAKIRAGSKRYNAKIMVAGAIRKARFSPTWFSKILLVQGDSVSYLDCSAHGEQELVRAILERVSAKITRVVTPVVKEPHRVLLRVYGVTGEPLNQLITNLKNLNAAIAGVELLKLNIAYVELAINSLISVPNLTKILGGYDKIVPRRIDQQEPSVDLVYQWIGENVASTSQTINP